MEKIIKGEEKFQVLATEFVLGPSNQEYYLYYSADGINYTKWEDKVPAKETLIVNQAVCGMWYYCKYNQTKLLLKWS